MAKKPIRLGVSGALGKMGQRILALAAEDPDFKTVLALERISHPEIGETVCGIEVVSDLERVRDVDGLIEFTTPEATMQHLSFAVKFKKAMCIGTTALTDVQKKSVSDASGKIPIVFSPNMSIGVNVLFQLVGEASARLPAEYKAAISEAHHIHKKDTPSGTAKYLADIIRCERRQEDIDIKSVRQGEIIGDHEVIFEGPLDIIKLSHSAKSRDIFARGALQAMKFCVRRKSGLYTMADVLKEIK